MDTDMLKQKVYEIFHPSFDYEQAKGLIVDLRKDNFDKMVEKYCDDYFPGDHLVFYMSAPKGEYAKNGTTIFFYVWDYEEIGPEGGIIGKGTIQEVLNIQNNDPRAWEENDEKRSSFSNREEIIKHCAQRILKIKFNNLEFTLSKENYYSFENIIKDLYSIDIDVKDWDVLLEYFSPDDVGHLYLSEQQIETINRKLKTDKFIIQGDSYDSVLDIPNKAALEKFGPYIFKQTIRKCQNCSLIFFDIDEFKNINTTYSWMGGDEVLKEVIKTIKEKCVEEGQVLFKFGGDEFVLVLLNCSQEKAFEIAEKIRTNIEQLGIMYKDKTIKSTLSLGVSSTENLIDINWKTLLNYAQQAALKAKKSKNIVVEYSGDEK